jgi:asparagine synthase (glutamine-hydrolysing)
MCGIAGIFSPGGPTSELVERGGEMIRTLGHRGPDGFSVVALRGAVLAHARLATIDLVTGTQPKGNEDGSVQVVLNGEIYNYRELRAELETRGHRFRTQSDTEVIPYLYEEAGDEFVTRLRGMFALALYDARRNRLVLARDRLGKKPLYWARTPAGLHFASEPRALLGVEEVDRRVDPEAICHYLTWQYVPAPWSIYRGIRKLPAAHLLVADASGERMSRFWDDKPSPLPPLAADEALDRLRATLAESCRIRLRCDVPVGAFLSGGIDSGLVAAFSQAAFGRPLRAVTIGFGDDGAETPLARQTARKLGLDHLERELAVDAAATVETVLSFADEPHGDASCVPTWLVCEAARESVTVALSGDGGDETFAGYASRYAEQLALDRVRRFVPAAVRSAVFRPMARIWPKSARLPRPLRLTRVLESAGASAFDAYAADRSIWRAAELAEARTPELAQAAPGFDPRAPLAELFERCEGAEPLEALLFLDRHTYLAEGVLAKVDRMSMAHGLEVRSPLLDHEIVELSLRVAASDKIRGGTGKRILRRLASEVLPPEVVTARKSGFAPPVSAWIRGPLRPLVERRLLDPASFAATVIRAPLLRRMVAEHQEGSRDFGQKIWSLLALELWAERRGRAS